LKAFNDELNQQLIAIREQGLYRELRRIDSPQSPHIQIDGRSFLNFSSNDYLGLASDPVVKEAAKKAIDDFGAGAGASRLICGSLTPHHQLEQTLAEFKGTEAALTFSSGYATALGTITALIDKNDVIVTDKLIHASFVDAARLSGAKLRVFCHNELEELEEILKWSQSRPRLAPHRSRQPRTLIVTESVFSMDGDLALLREIIELKEKYGAWLMLDEAHATGIFGQGRRGLAEAYELADRIEIQMGTLGKALGAAGGYICGSRALVDLLINRARSFIFSTAPTPAAAAAASAAIRFVQSSGGEARRATLWARVDQLKNGLAGGPWNVPVIRSPIIPILIGEESAAMQKASGLRSLGLFVPAIRYPSVARGQARLRVTVSASHSAADVEQLLCALRAL